MGVTSALVFYIIPGLLGRGYNMDKDTVGPDLFKASDTKDKSRVIEKYITTSEYKLVEDLEEAKDFLDVSGKLALKLKTGNLNVEGAGSYLKQASSFHNKIELLFKVYFETVTVTIPSHVQPHPDWKKFVDRSRDTHYIRSITYGGNLIASVSFMANTKSDLQHIKASVEAEMSSKSGSFGGDLKGQLEKIQNSTEGSSSMSINYFATVPLTDIPRDIEGLTKLVQSFPEQTKKVNDGKGVPVQMEIFSLKALQGDIENYFQTVAFTNNVVMLEEQLTDLRNARRRLNDWMHTIPPKLSADAKSDITNFNNKLEKATKAVDEVIAKVDLTAKGTSAQFLTAFQAYKGDSQYTYPDMYVKELSKLKVRVLNKVQGLDPNFGGALYTHWGSDKCPRASTLVGGTEGKMASTIKISVGTTQFLCLPTNGREYIPVEIKDSDDEESTYEDLPEVNEVVFKSRGDQRGGDSGYSVQCARCRIPGKTTVTMLPGQSACPSGWTLQYKGVLTSTDYNSVRSELACLDYTKGTTLPPISHNNQNNILTEVSMSKNSGSSIACVVCSTEKNTSPRSSALYLV